MTTSETFLAAMKQLHPQLIDLSLGRIERLLARLGNPHHKLPPVVHIAGTNGKGSVTAYLKAMFEAGGMRAHVYTSPHLVHFHERIVLARPAGAPTFIKGEPIGEAALVDVLSRTEAVNAGDDITQFEITTAAAFLAFAEHPADVLLLEVGLGGRLDATNVIARPRRCIITPVSMDHAEKLGATVGLIAAEKAGILKSGVRAVIAAQSDEAGAVIEETARRVGAPLVTWGRDYDAYEQRGRLIVQKDAQLLDLPLPALLGRHQIANAGAAVAAALELADLGLDEKAIEGGLTEVRWPARMQRLDHGPLPGLLEAGSELWLDGGHNPAAGEVIAQTLADLDERLPRPVYLVCGMMGLKDAAGFLGPFRGLAKEVVCVPIPSGNEPPHAPATLASAALSLGLTARTAPNVPEALRAIAKAAPGPKRVLICGSLYLAGQVLALQQGIKPQSN